jgi:hypothetical protein
MRAAILFARPDIEHNHLALPGPLEQSFLVDGFCTIEIAEESLLDPLDLSESILGKSLEGAKELAYGLSCKPVDYEPPLLLCIDQTAGEQNLEMLRSIGDGSAYLFRQSFHGPRRLCQKVEELKSFRAGECLPRSCELAIHQILECSLRQMHITLFN